jgi:hypothetical protein
MKVTRSLTHSLTAGRKHFVIRSPQPDDDDDDDDDDGRSRAGNET